MTGSVSSHWGHFQNLLLTQVFAFSNIRDACYTEMCNLLPNSRSAAKLLLKITKPGFIKFREIHPSYQVNGLYGGHIQVINNFGQICKGDLVWIVNCGLVIKQIVAKHLDRALFYH